MTTNNNISCLPFYKSLDDIHSAKTYSFGRVYPLLTPLNHLLPFVIFRKNRSSRSFSIRMYNIKGNMIKDVSEQISQTGLNVQAFDGYDVISYDGRLPFCDDMAEGFYYLRFNDGNEIWYSDLFQSVADWNNLLCIEWWDEEPLHFNGGCIPYDKSRFVNRLFFDTEIGKPEYNFNEEGEERDGFFFPVSQLSEKVYKFVAIAPEYLCDVMRTIRMSDHIRISSKGNVYDAEQFLCNVEWQEQGDLASVVCEFQTNTIIKKVGQGRILGRALDFNTDYNNDYLSQG